MIQVNLIPDVKQELLRAQTQRNVVISIAIILAIAAGAVVVLVALYVFGAQKLIMDNADKTIDTEYSTLSQVEDLDQLLTVQNQLKRVSVLDADKNITSRLFGMLNVIVTTGQHEITVSSLSVMPVEAQATGTEEDGASSDASQGAVVTLEGQAVGSYASLEVFEKTIAAAVIEYNLPEGATETGDIDCGEIKKQCRRLVEGGGDRAQAVQVSEMSFGEDESGNKTLRFKLSFTVVPELLSNLASDVVVKIGARGNVTDSYVNTPRAIFRDRAQDEGGQ